MTATEALHRLAEWAEGEAAKRAGMLRSTHHGPLQVATLRGSKRAFKACAQRARELAEEEAGPRGCHCWGPEECHWHPHEDAPHGCVIAEHAEADQCPTCGSTEPRICAFADPKGHVHSAGNCCYDPFHGGPGIWGEADQ